VEQRLQALALAEKSIAAKVVQAITEVSVRSISDLKKKARSRGYDPQISRVLKLEYVEDAPRSGRPLKITPAIETVILDNVQADRHDRKKTADTLKYEHDVASSTILRMLKRNGFRSCKTTMKSELDAVMMKARLQFCLRYKN
jgi:transposase